MLFRSRPFPSLKQYAHPLSNRNRGLPTTIDQRQRVDHTGSGSNRGLPTPVDQRQRMITPAGAGVTQRKDSDNEEGIMPLILYAAPSPLVRIIMSGYGQVTGTDLWMTT
jgi:hypothetical protein